MVFSIFKAYDVRGIYPADLNEESTALITRALIELTSAKKILIGRDVRGESEKLAPIASAVARELGVKTIDAGTVSTDAVYYGVGVGDYGAGMIFTASHTQVGYAGIKMTDSNVVPIAGEGVLKEKVKEIIERGDTQTPRACEADEKIDLLAGYIDHVLGFLSDIPTRKARIAVNPNFGTAGRFVEAIARRLPIELIKLDFEPNPLFPKGQPDPYLPERQIEIGELIRSSKADFGVSWDADADRCIIFDETGEVVLGDYVEAVLAKHFLTKEPGATIVVDMRRYWTSRDVIEKLGGKMVLSRIGHAPIKKKMRELNSIFACEKSGHYFFRDNFFADNGMIPWLLLYEEWSKRGGGFSELFNDLPKYATTKGEVNFEIEDKEAAMRRVKEYFKDAEFGEMDGVEIKYPDWRCNVRPSNTEPLLRLTIEGKDQRLVDEKVRELSRIIKASHDWCF